MSKFGNLTTKNIRISNDVWKRAKAQACWTGCTLRKATEGALMRWVLEQQGQSGEDPEHPVQQARGVGAVKRRVAAVTFQEEAESK